MINPFVFSNSTGNTKMVGIEFATTSGPMSVNGTAEPIEIVVEGKGPFPKPENATLSIDEEGRMQSSYHTIEIKNTSFLLNIGVELDEERPKLYVVFGPKSERPNLKRHWNKTELPDNSSCTWVDTERHDEDEPIDLLTLQDWDEVNCARNPYSFFLSDTEELYGNYTYGKYFHQFKILCLLLFEVVARCGSRGTVHQYGGERTLLYREVI